jgi:transposase
MVARLIRTATSPACFVGADVSKAWVDMADTQGRVVQVANTVTALTAALSGWSGCARLVCEATGGYERALIAAAAGLGLPLRRAHPSRVRAFAKATARAAKTDRIDAAVLAAFAAFTAHEAAPPPPSPAQRALAELMARLTQLKDQRQAELCRAEQAETLLVQRSIAAIVDLLDIQVKAITHAMDEAIAADPALAHKAALLRSCKGIGPRASQAILAWLPEIGTLNRRTVAGPGGGRTHHPPERILDPIRRHRRRPKSLARRPVHGGALGQPAQSDLQSLLRPPANRRKTAQGCPRRRAPQTRHHTQCHDPGRTTLPTRLTKNTVDCFAALAMTLGVRTGADQRNLV